MAADRPIALLRPITPARFDACVSLKVAADQLNLVASNLYSLAEAAVDPHLHPRGIYDRTEWVNAPAAEPQLKGFTMFEVRDGTGFIKRLMIGQTYQRRGYGHAAMLEVIRQLRLTPEVNFIATSHHRDNTAAAALYQTLGFIPWQPTVDTSKAPPTESFLKLRD